MKTGRDELSIEAIKARLSIPDAARLLGMNWQPGKSCTSPFRPDKHPSFSVFQDGQRFRDHASGDSGTVIDFIQKALDVSLKEAIQWAREKCGGPVLPVLPGASVPMKKASPATKAKPAPKLRAARPGELEALASLRGFKVETLTEAQGRGLLAFANVWGRVAWLVCDPGGRIAEGRRLDGLPWEAYGGMPARKCHAWGGQKNWPVNLEAAAQCSKLALVEGGPDALAALEIIRREGAADVDVVAMLGAANTRLDAAALPFFKGKLVRLFPHADEAGQRAAREWALALREAGAVRVDAFDLSGIMRSDGKAGKDLCDVLNIAPGCAERLTKFRGRMMP
jgi:CHC2 zinc finger/Toprim-like